MQCVPRILGVELGEKFNIMDGQKEYGPFVFSLYGLHKVDEDGGKSFLTYPVLMESLLNGKLTIKPRVQRKRGLIYMEATID